MLQLLTDGVVAYDSTLEEYTLLGLKTTTGLNKGGTAEIVMPPGHPAYNSFISFKTIVELYDNGDLVFRGRPLYPKDSFYNIRTITCEGERCFLRDGIMRPYIYQGSPSGLFSAGLTAYNEQATPERRFRFGQVTVTDPNEYLRIESENPESCAAYFDKLVERCGGYITFSTDENGNRCMNWLESIGTHSTQPIEFGQNLLEFERGGESPELYTAVLPYGAQLEDGSRVTIESVNGGQDWIQDDDAVALRGFIIKDEYWDDVTDPAHLLTKARAWLDEHKLAVVSLQLTAADLSRLDRSIDTYRDGDLVQVISKPHSMDGWLQLTERTTDWLDPTGHAVTLGYTTATLTGADVIAATNAARAAAQGKQAAVQAARVETAARIQQTETTLRSEIQQLAGSITLEVSGGLGNSAAIRLNVNGEPQTYTMDLSDVRKAFADDSSTVEISAGKITFTGGTIVINSSKFQVDASGKITATDAVIHGDIITIDGPYKTEMDLGSLRLYYDDALCGTINTKYWSGASGEGVSLRIEEAGSYIMFSHPSDAGTGYDVDYYLNYGWSTNYKEMHIFQTSARFLSDVYLDGKTDIGSLRLRGPNGKRYLIQGNDNGTVTCSVL